MISSGDTCFGGFNLSDFRVGKLSLILCTMSVYSGILIVIAYVLPEDVLLGHYEFMQAFILASANHPSSVAFLINVSQPKSVKNTRVK